MNAQIHDNILFRKRKQQFHILVREVNGNKLGRIGLPEPVNNWFLIWSRSESIGVDPQFLIAYPDKINWIIAACSVISYLNYTQQRRSYYDPDYS